MKAGFISVFESCNQRFYWKVPFLILNTKCTESVLVTTLSPFEEAGTLCLSLRECRKFLKQWNRDVCLYFVFLSLHFPCPSHPGKRPWLWLLTPTILPRTICPLMHRVGVKLILADIGWGARYNLIRSSVHQRADTDKQPLTLTFWHRGIRVSNYLSYMDCSRCANHCALDPYPLPLYRSLYWLLASALSEPALME